MNNTTTCQHEEKIENVGRGISYGTCSKCDQIRQYDTLNEKNPPKIIRLGRINGVIVAPKEGEIKQLPSEEAAELEVAREEGVHIAEQKNEDIATKVEAPGNKRQKSSKVCKECPFYELYDEAPWCNSKRWPSRVPMRLRPPYRIPEKEPTDRRGKEWYYAHKKEMIEDLISMGNTAFLEKWKVHSSIISHLKSDKLYKIREGTLPKPPPERKPRRKSVGYGLAAAIPIEPVTGSLLPAFPPFSDKWTEMVQLRWFDTYRALAEKASEEDKE